MDMRSNFGMDHALAVLGGVSALTQLIHRISTSVSVAVAFPCTIRRIGHNVDGLVQGLLDVTTYVNWLLEWFKNHSGLSSHVIKLLNQCRGDTMTLSSLLGIYRSGSKMKMSFRCPMIMDGIEEETVVDFIDIRENIVEDFIPLYRTSIGLVTSYFAGYDRLSIWRHYRQILRQGGRHMDNDLHISLG